VSVYRPQLLQGPEIEDNLQIEQNIFVITVQKKAIDSIIGQKYGKNPHNEKWLFFREYNKDDQNDRFIRRVLCKSFCTVLPSCIDIKPF